MAFPHADCSAPVDLVLLFFDDCPNPRRWRSSAGAARANRVSGPAPRVGLWAPPHLSGSWGPAAANQMGNRLFLHCLCFSSQSWSLLLWDWPRPCDGGMIGCGRQRDGTGPGIWEIKGLVPWRTVRQFLMLWFCLRRTNPPVQAAKGSRVVYPWLHCWQWECGFLFGPRSAG
jgi:hypothetical protein